MKNLTIVGQPLPNMPWEERPAGSNAVLWRYSNNPVIPRDLLPDSNSIFNSAVVPFKDGFAGVFRCDDTNRRMTLHAGFSKDGINWDIRPDKLVFDGDYGYDPRVAFIEDRYWVTWCNGYHGPTIGAAWTQDFETFHQVATAYCSRARLAASLPCSPARPTPATPPSVTFSTAKPPTWNSGDTIGTSWLRLRSR